jgi:hypothetical protein
LTGGAKVRWNLGDIASSSFMVVDKDKEGYQYQDQDQDQPNHQFQEQLQITPQHGSNHEQQQTSLSRPHTSGYIALSNHQQDNDSNKSSTNVNSSTNITNMSTSSASKHSSFTLPAQRLPLDVINGYGNADLERTYRGFGEMSVTDRGNIDRNNKDMYKGLNSNQGSDSTTAPTSRERMGPQWQGLGGWRSKAGPSSSASSSSAASSSSRYSHGFWGSIKGQNYDQHIHNVEGFRSSFKENQPPVLGPVKNAENGGNLRPSTTRSERGKNNIHQMHQMIYGLLFVCLFCLCCNTIQCRFCNESQCERPTIFFITHSFVYFVYIFILCLMSLLLQV